MRIFLGLVFCLTLWSCSTNSAINPNCQFLLDIPVNETVNLNFPQYIQLQSPSNPVYIPNVGNGGIIVTNVGSGFAAFDAADPNRTFSSCSVLTITGLTAVNSCDDRNEYNLFTGQAVSDGNLPCTLKRYRVEQNANLLLIFN